MTVVNATDNLVKLLAVVREELEDRLDDELSDRDWLAVTTALHKGILAGFLEGVAEVSTNATVLVRLPTGGLAKSEGCFIDSTIGLEVCALDYDEWHEHFGED